MCADTLVSVNKSMVADQAVAKTGALLLQGREIVDITKSLKRRTQCRVQQSLVTQPVRTAVSLISSP